MQNIVIRKWVEPYVLLETFKKNFDMTDITFDGFSKEESKSKMYKILESASQNKFGLYMKNVNKFYVFSSSDRLEVKTLMELVSMSNEDFELVEDPDLGIQDVDIAKAEAAIILS